MQRGLKVRQGWKKPPEKKLMINIDYAFDAKSGSTGVVIRDSGGGLLAMTNKSIPRVLDAPNG